MLHFRTGIACVLMGLLLAGPASGQATVDALLYAPAADARLDALLAGGSPEELAEAEALYLRLLSRVGSVLSPEEAVVLRKHVARLALVMPEGLQARVADGDLQKHPERVLFKAGAGEALLAWWRRQDPLPATPRNERLEEHLLRLTFAERQYPLADRATGFDDRGVIYVQYGAPSRITNILFNNPKLMDAVYQPGVVVNLSDFPDNEVWWYQHIDRAGYYLFVKKGAQYRRAETYDLMPSTLRYGLGSSDRSKRKATMLLAVMRDVYRQLAMHHPDFAMRFQDVDDYALREEEILSDQRSRLLARQEAQLQRAGSQRRAGTLTNNNLTRDDATLDPLRLSPQEFVEHILFTSRIEDEQAFYRREESMPEQFTEVFRDIEILPLSVRTARFLDDDGATRTEIYWSPTPGGLRFSGKQQKKKDPPTPDVWPPNQFLIHLTAIQQTADYQDRQTSRKPYLVTDLPDVQDAAIPAQTMTVHGDTGVYNLALQWDQHRARASEAEGVRVGPKVQVATHRLDSLTALHADERVLEMSDLKPIFVADLSALDADGASGEPYPHTQIWPELPLGLYFEIYHLAFGDDDQTHYTIAYEIARSQKRGLLRFLGRGDEERTTVQTAYTGQTRTARETIVLDMSEWQGQGGLEVRVHVTDDATGREVERVLVFELLN